MVANLEAYAASGEDGPLDLDSLTDILIAVADPAPENLPGKLKYMHLASGAKEQAMALLDEPAPCIQGAYTE